MEHVTHLEAVKTTEMYHLTVLEALQTGGHHRAGSLLLGVVVEFLASLVMVIFLTRVVGGLSMSISDREDGVALIVRLGANTCVVVISLLVRCIRVDVCIEGISFWVFSVDHGSVAP
jgi:hypothetical protein